MLDRIVINFFGSGEDVHIKPTAENTCGIVSVSGVTTQVRWTLVLGLRTVKQVNVFVVVWRQHLCTHHHHLHVQGGPKNWHILFLYALTLWNINWFMISFYCQNQKQICNNTITKNIITPEVCRYTTLWNVKLSQKQQFKQDNFCNNTF